MDAYERFILRDYARRALAGDERGARRPSRALAAWLHDHAALLGAREPEVEAEALETFPPGLVDRGAWAQFGALVEGLRRRGKAPPRSTLQRRLDWLAATLKLSEPDLEVLGLATRTALLRPVHTLAHIVSDSGGEREEIHRRAIAQLLGLSVHAARRRLGMAQPLRVLGLLEDRGGNDYAASQLVLKVARLGTTSPDRLREALIGKPRRAELGWDDFAHLGEARELAERLLGGALAAGAPGVNILFHGSPGTGKTEFVRTLAERLDAHAIFVGEADEDQEEPSRSSRVAAYAVSRALAGRAGRTILAVDEADDVFTGVDEDDASARQGSKVFMNRLVERTEAPTIWITNHPERLGPAVLRRMAVAIRFPEPGREVRRRVLERAARRRRLKLGPAAVEALSAIEAAPAVIDQAVRVAKLSGGGEADAARAARSILEVIRGPAAPAPVAGATPFDPALSNADMDLEALARGIAGSGERAVSLCLSGLPGTGKSAFARHLAGKLGLEVMERRASDLLSMWVGETEKAVALAFREAADRRAMLIFDEADSLLRDRAGARASWEVAQVNEMLSWMERHPMPFVCTTNLVQSLDPATLRRFLFKVAFLPMTEPQAVEAFRRAFAEEPPRGLARLDPLTPGDFAVVARKAAVLGECDPSALLAMLAAEVAAKPGAGAGRMGF